MKRTRHPKEDLMAMAESATSVEPTAGGKRSQAVDKVVDILELLATAQKPLSLNEVASGTGAHRSVVYRLLRTLEDRRLVDRTSSGYRLGELMLVFANAVHSDLRDLALVELTELSSRFGATAFLAVEDGGRSVCLQTVEPAKSLVHVAVRPGLWGPMDVGAPALAILSGRPEAPDDPEGVKQARARGYATSSGNEYDARGLQWVGSPIISEPLTRASICMVFPAGTLDVDAAGTALSVSAARLSSRLVAGN